MPASRSGYIELHARSAFSFLRGATQPEHLVEASARLGMPGLAVMDRDGVFGSARVHYAAGKLVEEGRPSLRPLVGAELTMEDGTALPLLVRTRTGYQNLCQLITRSKLRAPKGESRVGWAELPEFAEGLVCLTGDDEGTLRQAVARDDRPAAEQALQRLVTTFGKNGVYVELQRHRARGEDWVVRRLVELAEAARLPILATNGVCYATARERVVLDAFTCLRHHTTLDAAGRLLSLNSERCLKGPQQMQALFADFPQAIQNTLRLADRVEFTLENLGYEFPAYPTPPGETMAQALRREAYEGARKLYGPTLPRIVRDKLEHELPIIDKLGFNGYFLLVWEIVRFAVHSGILIQGRGSAANSAVCFCLGITKVDPTKQNLLFERFLSEGRKGWPDIDLDLPSGERREAVIQHVYEKYAPRGAAMTANVICYRGRSAMREMGKVLGLPEDALGRFSDLFANGDFPHTLTLSDQIEKAGLARHHPRLPALLKLYHGVYGLPRHLGQHSGGMVISDKPLDTVVPLENASMPGRVVVQWDKDDCEDLGMVKVDLLGLGMMAVVQDTLEMCQARDRAVNWERLAETEDAATYDLMQRADTVGVFQIESRAQMATLPRMKPRCFYDVAIEVAIIRPGPIVGQLVHPFLERRCGRQPVDYIHPDLEPVLKRTLGVPLFQEQILEIAMKIADFTGSSAEELRRAMSFHRSEERMIKVVTKLRAAMTARNITQDVQDKVVQSIQSFALYGFPESHAISFALLAYGSAWLKVHRAPEFYSGLLNNQPMGFYSSSSLVHDAKAHGLRVLPVCVNISEEPCTVVDDATIRLGLRQVRGLCRASAQRILQLRTRAPFESLTDFLLRTDLPKDERRVLAKIGALNALLPRGHRRAALWEVENHVDPDDLFSWARRRDTELAAAGEITLQEPAVPLWQMTPVERLEADYEGVGLSVGPHPMALIRKELQDVWRASDLKTAQHGERVTIAGMVICRQRPGTAKGHVFISLEDETGISNAFVHSDMFERNRLTITQEPFLRITGGLQHIDDVLSVYAVEITALPYRATLGTQSYDFH